MFAPSRPKPAQPRNLWSPFSLTEQPSNPKTEQPSDLWSPFSLISALGLRNCQQPTANRLQGRLWSPFSLIVVDPRSEMFGAPFFTKCSQPKPAVRDLKSEVFGFPANTPTPNRRLYGIRRRTLPGHEVAQCPAKLR